jgi:hypothetical protein
VDENEFKTRVEWVMEGTKEGRVCLLGKSETSVVEVVRVIHHYRRNN